MKQIVCRAAAVVFLQVLPWAGVRAQSPEHSARQAAEGPALSVEGLRNDLRRGDAASVDRACRFISSAAAPEPERRQAALLLLDVVETGPTMDRLLEWIRDWQSRPEVADPGFSIPFAIVLRNLASEPWRSAACSHPGLLPVVSQGLHIRGEKSAFWLDLFTCIPPSREKSRIGESVVLSMPAHPVLTRSLIESLDHHSIDALLAAVQPTEDHSVFHYGAASVLAHLGDERVRASLVAMSESTASSPRAQEVFREWIRLLDLQATNETLLNFIRSGDLENITQNTRFWAIGRAVDRDIPIPDIRTALEDWRINLERVTFGLRDNASPSGRQLTRRRVLGAVKAVAIELGVLHDHDWPEALLPPANHE